MTEAVGPSRWSFDCRDVGYSCEWRLRAPSVAEIQARFREHARCAHQLPEVSADLLGRVGGAARPA
jgi:predicted small metal-binding protein